MKKLIIAAIAIVTLAVTVPSTANAGDGRGGCMGGLIGCCFGIRAAADYNEGMDISMREWLRLVPVISIFVTIMDTFDGFSGVSRGELNARSPSYF